MSKTHKTATNHTDEPLSMTRRTFVGVAGATVAGTALAATALSPLAELAMPQVALAESGASEDTGAPSVQFDREVYTLCEGCVWRCGVRAKVRGDKLVKLDGNPFHPHSNGMLCPRGQAGIATAYDPNRLLTPLIRKGKRGEGVWQSVSWNDALDYVAQRMLEIKDKYGAEAMVFSTTHNLLQPVFENLMKAYGSPNYGTQRSLCFNAMIVANLMTYGMEEPGRDYSQLKYLILTGRNLTEAISTSETTAFMDALARGVKVVYLDPRFTKTASKATEWLPIRQGTDLAFHLALLNVIIGEKLYNAKFVADYTVGFDELAAQVAGYTPEWAAPLTDLPAETIRRIAREFAAAAPFADTLRQDARPSGRDFGGNARIRRGTAGPRNSRGCLRGRRASRVRNRLLRRL